ncbi:unnamed protein product [Mesocestoides corti]|uniref:BPTI/Kunitz inhibitor domain-containing protein n=1 Tax=Mesocestoides corti TaxID=53468 RepID=A0A0R3UD63_MESCO|nr:unnamed protein product [Mesocestoides corti]
MPIPAANDGTLDPVCKLPKEVGPCRAAVRRWTYDLSKGQCVEFTYGGCLGNANNFKTKEACEAKCGGKMLLTEYSQRVYQCMSFRHFVALQAHNYKLVPYYLRRCMHPWVGVEPHSHLLFIHFTEGQSESKDDSIPESGADVVDTTVCQLPLEQGNCRASIQRWGFDASRGRCVQFIYGGCGGNANNFESKEACEQRCIVTFGQVMMSLQCNALLSTHQFMKCVRWFRDGCFTLECLLPTPANIPMPIPVANDETLDPVCKLPKDVGPCRAAVRRWTYDLSNGQCVEFTYGGCRGNANNFETKEACEAKCGGKILPTQNRDHGLAHPPW